MNDPLIIADKLNEYFVNIGPTLAKDIPSNTLTPLHFMARRIQDSIFLNPVVENEVLQIISNLKNSSPG